MQRAIEEDLRAILLEKNIKVKDLAKQLNVSVSYVYYILDGKRKAREMRKKIKKILSD